MKPIKTTFIPVFPSTHVRVNRKELWMLTKTDEYMAELDEKKLLEKGKKGGALRRKRQLEVNFAHKQELRSWAEATGFKMPHGYFAVWYLVPMPPSWRKKKRDAMRGQPHQNTPDFDNFTKQLFDAIMPRRNRVSGEKGADDRKIHCCAIFKKWVDYEDAGMKIVEYDPVEFMAQFEETESPE